jgi:hypothetical protein
MRVRTLWTTNITAFLLGTAMFSSIAVETTSMNTVIRMIGGAVGTQVVSALIAGHQHNGYPTLSGFTQSYVAEAAFLILAAITALLAGQGQQARS